MYKVYINGRPFFMGTPDETGELGLLFNKKVLQSSYLGKKKQLKQIIDTLEKGGPTEAVVLFVEDDQQLWADFQACFPKVQMAAGGYVLNADEKLLVFWRRESWDMPKGKIDQGETPEAAAVREVEEETGLKNITLGELLTITWHTYQHKGERVLKGTYWYKMTTTDTQVTPQTDEDIEKIEWVEPKAWVASKPEVYGSILDVIELGNK